MIGREFDSDVGVILNLAPTGTIPTRELSAFVPLSVAEVIEDVHAAWEIGITMVHLHAREPATAEPSHRAELFRQMIEGIRRFAPDLVICVSLSGRSVQEVEKRGAPLRLEGQAKPDMGSLTLSSVNFNRVASVSSPDTIQALAAEMQTRGILAELEAFDVGMINYARYLERKGLLEPPHYFNLLLGNIACAQADLLHAGIMVRDLPPQSYWSMAGIGDAQLTMNAIALAAGGGVRVGIEDNIWYDPQRTKLARNSDLVRRIHRLAEANERPIMSSTELRTRLNLHPGHGLYGRPHREQPPTSSSALSTVSAE